MGPVVPGSEVVIGYQALDGLLSVVAAMETLAEELAATAAGGRGLFGGAAAAAAVPDASEESSSFRESAAAESGTYLGLSVGCF